MSNVYYGSSVYRYFSLIDGRDDFKTPEEAHAADTDLAIRLVTITLPTEYEAALTQPRPDLAKALRWLANALDDVASAPVAASSPNT